MAREMLSHRQGWRQMRQWGVMCERIGKTVTKFHATNDY